MSWMPQILATIEVGWKAWEETLVEGMQGQKRRTRHAFCNVDLYVGLKHCPFPFVPVLRGDRYVVV